MEDTFLTNLEREGAISNVRSEEEEKETPPASSTEDKPAIDQPESLPGKEGKDETPASEKDAKPEVFRAFHEHPTWVKTQTELKELRAFRERVEPMLANLDKVKESVEQKTVEIPEWFGGDEHQWKKYQAYQNEELKRLRQELLDEQKTQSRKAVEEQKKWESWVEENVQTIVSDVDNVIRAKTIGFDLGNKEQVKSFRNELLKVAVEFKPTDEDNNISLLKALDILELQKLRKAPEKVLDKRKEIADKTIQKGKSEGSEKGYKTSADLRNKSFRDVVSDLVEN